MNITLSPFMTAILALELEAAQSPRTEATTELVDARGQRRTVSCRLSLGQAHSHRGAIMRTYKLDGQRSTLPLIQDQMEAE